jgi:hypothetical protein
METNKSRERQHKPVKQRYTHQTKSDKIKIQNKTEKKTGQKHKQSQQIPNTKQEFRFSRKNRCKRIWKSKQFISFLINLTLYSHSIQVGRIKKSLKIPKR